MTNPKQDPKQHEGEQYDAPNQQAVGGAHPSVEGTGGQPGKPGAQPTPDQPGRQQQSDQQADQPARADQLQAQKAAESHPTGSEPELDLDAMSRQEMLEEAQRRGLDVKTSDSKAELRDALERG
jgi:hypothetical protein